MVMVDALRHDYINETDAPFLHSLGRQGARGSLIPSFGFEPDGAYFAGLDPEECDGGAQYWHKPGERDFYLTGLFRPFYKIPSKWLRKNIRRSLRLTAQLLSKDSMVKKKATTSCIPLSELSKFSLSMRKLPTDKGFMPQPTIFDVLKENNIKYYAHIHPAHKVHIENVVSRYIEEAKDSERFSFLFVGTLDGIGHKYGPRSDELKAGLKKVDHGLEEIYKHACKLHDEVEILVFGDHGMAQVDRHIDLSNAIKMANLSKNDDTYFLDSTFARFWVSDKTKRANLINILNDVPGGHVLTQDECNEYCIRFKHNYFGDIIYAVEDGAIIQPSYYCEDNNPPVGMHGYLPGCRDNESAFVFLSDKTKGIGDLGRVDMRRLFPTVLDALDLIENTNIPHDLKCLV